VNQNKEKARKANQAVDAIGHELAAKLTKMRPSVAVEYDLDDQLVTLAITKAAVGLAADAASQATGMGTDEYNQLEERLHEVVFDAMNELLGE
jgi:hypothetical protein